MRFIKAFSSGAVRAFRSAKALLIIWLLTFTVLAVFSYPLKAFLNSALGNTASTDLLNDGFSLSYFADLGQSFQALMSVLTGGILILLLVFFFLYVFLTGGLFDSLVVNKWSYKPGDYFRASARFFLSYLFIKLLVLLMILIAMFIIIGLPLIIQGAGSSGSEEVTLRLVKILRIVALLILPLFLLVADYSRVWIVANDQRKVFKALGYGFKATFRSFFSSYFFMLIMVIIQGLYIMLVTRFLSGYAPESGTGLFLLFISSQVLFLFKLYLRALRYGGVAELYQL
ncbi:MAG: hypothetical protein KFF49_09700 [Bacteroidales bacterium]|nr:hypothetical protein [Bacteroidales bacterium]